MVHIPYCFSRTWHTCGTKTTTIPNIIFTFSTFMELKINAFQEKTKFWADILTLVSLKRLGFEEYTLCTKFHSCPPYKRFVNYLLYCYSKSERLHQNLITLFFNHINVGLKKKKKSFLTSSRSRRAPRRHWKQKHINVVHEAEMKS